jgi:hypothetical protein
MITIFNYDVKINFYVACAALRIDYKIYYKGKNNAQPKRGLGRMNFKSTGLKLAKATRHIRYHIYHVFIYRHEVAMKHV